VQFQSQLKAYANLVEGRLDAVLPDSADVPGRLHEAMRYSALAPGKRLRPALVLGAAVAVGGDPADALDAAVAVELVHCFSLIHDDLPALDDDALRRGRPTCHVQFGEAVAILAGDALFALAFDALSRTPGPSDRILRCVSVLTRATMMLVSGETVDILSEGQPVSRETLSLIHRYKTGALIAASCEMGALLGGGTEEDVVALREYGEAIGLAFQIADDVLNETSTPEQLGKAAGSDRERGKATYPALFGLEASRDEARAAAQRGVARLPHADPFLTEVALFAVERLN
jgi:geranylgeranyl diphosphate synthase, type II